MAVQMIGTGCAAAAAVHSGAATAQGGACGGCTLRRARRAGAVRCAGADQVLQTQACGLGGHGFEAIECSTADNAATTAAACDAAGAERRGRTGDHAQAAASSTTAASGGAVHA